MLWLLGAMTLFFTSSRRAEAATTNLCFDANLRPVSLIARDIPYVAEAYIVGDEPLIAYNPYAVRLLTLSTWRFVILHECGHLRLFTTNERSADCFAIRRMREFGLLQEIALREIESDIEKYGVRDSVDYELPAERIRSFAFCNQIVGGLGDGEKEQNTLTLSVRLNGSGCLTWCAIEAPFTWILKRHQSANFLLFWARGGGSHSSSRSIISLVQQPVRTFASADGENSNSGEM